MDPLQETAEQLVDGLIQAMLDAMPAETRSEILMASREKMLAEMMQALSVSARTVVRHLARALLRCRVCTPESRCADCVEALNEISTISLSNTVTAVVRKIWEARHGSLMRTQDSLPSVARFRTQQPGLRRRPSRG